jgi:hypothetical protein
MVGGEWLTAGERQRRAAAASGGAVRAGGALRGAVCLSACSCGSGACQRALIASVNVLNRGSLHMQASWSRANRHSLHSQRSPATHSRPCPFDRAAVVLCIPSEPLACESTVIAACHPRGNSLVADLRVLLPSFQLQPGWNESNWINSTGKLIHRLLSGLGDNTAADAQTRQLLPPPRPAVVDHLGRRTRPNCTALLLGFVAPLIVQTVTT